MEAEGVGFMKILVMILDWSLEIGICDWKLESEIGTWRLKFVVEDQDQASMMVVGLLD